MQPLIRDARPADVRPFEAIRIAGWKTAYAGLIDADVLDALEIEDGRVAEREQWLADLPAGHVMLVSELAGEVVGGAILMPSRDDDAPQAAELLALYVEPARRFAGLGTVLLAAGFDRMPQPVQTLWVLEGNTAARQFYERHGFRVDGAHKVRTELGGQPAELRYRRARLA